MTRSEFEHTASEIRGRLLALAGRFTGATGLAGDEEDIVQEALTELWLLCESGYAVRNPEALAVRIVKTVCVRHHRRRRVETTPIDGRDYPGGVCADEGIEVREALRLRQWLFARLSETQRRCLEMRNERGMSLDEIALETGKPKASVKATLSQARRLMVEHLKQMQDE